MWHRADQTKTETSSAIDGLVQAACRVTGQDDIAAVHVILPRRPTYEELRRMRRCATRRGVEFGVGSSSISLRRRADPSEAGAPGAAIGMARPWGGALWRRSSSPSALPGRPAAMASVGAGSWLAPVAVWLRVHGGGWRAGLAGLSRGAR